jgi:hypothetical protein
MATIKAPAEVDISLVRGDSDDILVTVKDTAQPTQNLINLGTATDGTPSRPAVLRYAAKAAPSKDKNAAAAIFKASYRTDEIEVLPQTGLTVGQCVVKIDKPDTSDNKAGVYAHDFEVVRQDVPRPGAGVGTAAIVASAVGVTGTGTAFTKAKAGDVLHPTSGPNLGAPRLISKVVSATALEVEVAWETSDAAATFEIRRGKAKTAFTGKLTLVQDVVH